ncbi:hypothetical protein Slin15195_G028940 [Septoria linicola]|uniref:MARVEL domain-containing protein n=1 Tax=Septoria linicola TaxID=215465 RepID=A0A9Q9EG30_9PEZI|nr:hypothetical protein Slin14017_G027970 [Septoria linicola]USW49575.1 hypothetical protein Slin15195_G028940 [Septoria linicola]
MPVPKYGAAPLAKTFVLVRGLSLISMIAIVGMTANFVAQIVGSHVEAPKEIVGTLVITCMAALYCLISIPFFYAQANLGLLIMTATDFLLLLAFIVVSVVLGKPLSFLNCMIVADRDAAGNAQSAAAFTQALATNIGKSGSTLGLGNWAGSTNANCYETKAIWGLCISLAILFTCSSCILPTLWYKARKAAGGGKSVV